MKKYLLLTLLAFAVASCLPQDAQVPQSPLLPLLERKSGLIAYLGTDGNIYVSDQAGGRLSQLTDDAVISQNQGDPFRYYQFPSWSRDGSQVAFVGLHIQGELTRTNMYIHNLDLETTTQVYSSETEYPIYLNWSPDNASVGFITTTVSRDGIILKTAPASGAEGRILDAGAPYYWSWAPDGSVLIAHTGNDEAPSPEHFSFLRMDEGPTEYALDILPAAFQAPAWSPDGSRIALTRRMENENQIILTDGSGANPEVIGTFFAKTAFAWSPDGTKLAYLDASRTLSDGTIGRMFVYDLETSERIDREGNNVAFFWSPDSREIAYFVLLPIPQPEGSESTETQYALQLNVLDTLTAESREILTYRPTEQFQNILPYFDQYHQSSTIWSPDGNNFVLSFLDGEGNPGIAVVPTSGTLEPRLLAPGYIAWWSWE